MRYSIRTKDIDVPSKLQIDYQYSPTCITAKDRRERVSLPVASGLCDTIKLDKMHSIVWGLAKRLRKVTCDYPRQGLETSLGIRSYICDKARPISTPTYQFIQLQTSLQAWHLDAMRRLEEYHAFGVPALDGGRLDANVLPSFILSSSDMSDLDPRWLSKWSLNDSSSLSETVIAKF